MFVLYVIFLMYFLLFSESYGRIDTGRYRYNLVLFREIKRFWSYRKQLGMVSVLSNLFGNVFIFAPFGFFLPMASRYRSFFSALFYSLGLSFCVELLQLFSRIGSFDVDDLFLNTLGGIIGYVIFILCTVIRRKHDRKNIGGSHR